MSVLFPVQNDAFVIENVQKEVLRLNVPFLILNIILIIE